MPRVSTRPRSDEMMVAIDSGIFTLPDGTEHVIRIGTRVRATHPVVELSPHSFCSAALDDLEIAAARRQLLEGRGIHGRD